MSDSGRWMGACKHDNARDACLICKELAAANERADKAEKEQERLRDACARNDAEVCEAIGKALGYPRYCDMPPVNPGDPEDVARQAANEFRFTGEHVGITLVDEICRKLAAAEQDNARLREGIEEVRVGCLQAAGNWNSESGVELASAARELAALLSQPAEASDGK